MKTGSYLWDGEDWIPRSQWRGRVASRALNLVPDIAPYRSVITGELIGGRRQHRDHLRAHGCIEVGNEFVQPKPQEPPKGDVARDIQRAMQERGYH